MTTRNDIPDFECLDTEQVAGPRPNSTPGGATPSSGKVSEGSQAAAFLGYFAIGTFLGILFVMSEVASWYRIQEMFRFQSFHMYGIIGTAVIVAGISVQLIRKFEVRTLRGEPITLAPKVWGDSRIPGARYWIGGSLFGLGWALIGACPGPMFALLGGGVSIMVLGLVSAMAGTWAYAVVRTRLPH
jgi:uncharacterized membrane protein YedE/YeeE